MSLSGYQEHVGNGEEKESEDKLWQDESALFGL